MFIYIRSFPVLYFWHWNLMMASWKKLEHVAHFGHWIKCLKMWLIAYSLICLFGNKCFLSGPIACMQGDVSLIGWYITTMDIDWHTSVTEFWDDVCSIHLYTLLTTSTLFWPGKQLLRITGHLLFLNLYMISWYSHIKIFVSFVLLLFT
jgi:hypothetical protein